MALTLSGGISSSFVSGGITYQVQTFTGSGNLYVAGTGTLTAQVLLVGGGGGGSEGCGGTGNNAFGGNGGGGGGRSGGTDEKKDTLTVEEMEILNRLQAKAQKFAQAEQTTKDSDTKDTDYSSRIYGTNLSLLQNKY